MADLARLAGVSTITVSRALADSDLVNARTRERIQALAREHGYALNLSARNLRLRRSMTVAVVVEMAPDADRVMSGPYPLDLLGGISQILTPAGYGILLISLQAGGTNAIGDVDGVILLGQGPEEHSMRTVQDWGRPLVVWGAVSHNAGQVVVGSDNIRGGRQAAERFLTLGRSKPVFLGDPIHGEFAERQLGFQTALAPHRIKPINISVPSLTVAAGNSAVQQLLDQQPGVDALFAASDLLAIGAIRALLERGRRVPEDVSVIGFDDTPLGASYVPPLTSVHQDFVEAGTLLAQKILTMIGGQSAESETLPTHLIVRAT